MADRTGTTRRGFLDRKINLRWMLILLGIVVVIALIAGIMNELESRRALRDQAVLSANNIANTIALFSTQDVISRDWSTLQGYADTLVRQKPLVYVAIVNIAGNSVVHSDRNQLGRQFQRSAYGRDVIHAYAPVMRGTRQIATARVGLRAPGSR